MTLATIGTIVIAPSKISGYLLDITHAEGGSKARWFLSRGFEADDPQALSNRLASHAFANWPGAVVEAPPYGVKHRIVAPFPCPDGTSPEVLTVWLVEPGDTFAAFVTARPHRQKAG